jgi:4-aminobutyrate--pyruvate transaminase
MFVARLANELEAQILAEDPDTIAAMIAEPVMGAGGVIVPPEGYFPAIQEVLQKYNILMIADEVICGFGRTGKMFGSETFGITPDIMTFAKALSSGYQPIGAVAVSPAISECLVRGSAEKGVFGHGYTYSGHPVAARVALECLRHYEDDAFLDHIRKVSTAFQTGLAKLADHPLVGEVRGVGLLGAIELVRNKETKQGFTPQGSANSLLTKIAYENGLIVRPMPAGDAIGLCPPLIISEAEVDILLDKLLVSLNTAAELLLKESA